MAASRPALGLATRRARGNHGHHNLRCNCCWFGNHRWLGRQGAHRKGPEHPCPRSRSQHRPRARLCRARSRVGTQAPRLGQSRRAREPIQRECYYACDEYSHQFFVSDKDNPYSSEPGKHFSWIRGRQVGGKSILWGRQSYRWSDLDFEANLKEGIAVDWPIRYADIAPWYDYVEEFAGISGQAEGLPQRILMIA